MALTADQLQTLFNNLTPDQQNMLLQAMGQGAQAQSQGAQSQPQAPTSAPAGLPLDEMSMQAGMAAIKSKVATDELARAYLGQQIQRENILNNHGANTSYLSSLNVAQAMGPDILKIVSENITPYPGKQGNVVIVNAPNVPAPNVPSPAPSQPQPDPAPTADPTATNPVASAAAKSLLPTWAKALLAAGSLAATGIGGYAMAPKNPTVNVTTPSIQQPVAPQPAHRTDEIEVF